MHCYKLGMYLNGALNVIKYDKPKYTNGVFESSWIGLAALPFVCVQAVLKREVLTFSQRLVVDPNCTKNMLSSHSSAKVWWRNFRSSLEAPSMPSSLHPLAVQALCALCSWTGCTSAENYHWPRVEKRRNLTEFLGGGCPHRNSCVFSQTWASPCKRS